VSLAFALAAIANGIVLLVVAALLRRTGR